MLTEEEYETLFSLILKLMKQKNSRELISSFERQLKYMKKSDQKKIREFCDTFSLIEEDFDI